jgi:hypothetical protein
MKLNTIVFVTAATVGLQTSSDQILSSSVSSAGGLVEAAETTVPAAGVQTSHSSSQEETSSSAAAAVVVPRAFAEYFAAAPPPVFVTADTTAVTPPRQQDLQSHDALHVEDDVTSELEVQERNSSYQIGYWKYDLNMFYVTVVKPHCVIPIEYLSHVERWLEDLSCTRGKKLSMMR